MKNIRITTINGINFINLTPHAITIVNSDGTRHEFPPSGIVARIAVNRQKLEHSFPVDLFTTTLGKLEGLEEFDPGEDNNYTLIVSNIVKRPLNDWLFAKGFHGCGVFSPGELIRNESGQPVGCRGLDG